MGLYPPVVAHSPRIARAKHEDPGRQLLNNPVGCQPIDVTEAVFNHPTKRAPPRSSLVCARSKELRAEDFKGICLRAAGIR